MTKTSHIINLFFIFLLCASFSIAMEGGIGIIINGDSQNLNIPIGYAIAHECDLSSSEVTLCAYECGYDFIKTDCEGNILSVEKSQALKVKKFLEVSLVLLIIIGGIIIFNRIDGCYSYGECKSRYRLANIRKALNSNKKKNRRS